MSLAPGPLVQTLYEPHVTDWSVLHSHGFRLLLAVVAWRVFWMLRTLRGEDLRERRDPLSQRSNHRWKGYRS